MGERAIWGIVGEGGGENTLDEVTTMGVSRGFEARMLQTMSHGARQNTSKQNDYRVTNAALAIEKMST